MDYVQINGTKILVNHIVKLAKRPGGSLPDGDQAFNATIVDVNGQSHNALTGTGSHVDAYLKALAEALQLNEVGNNLSYHWFDVPAEVRVLAGTTATPEILYDGEALPGTGVTFTPQSDVVAIVKENKIFGLTTGRTTITAAKDGVEAVFSVSVTANNDGLSKSPKNVPAGQDITMQLFKAGTKIENKRAVWKSYDTAKATVNATTGVVRGVAQGEAYISATYDGVEYIHKIVVQPAAPEAMQESKTIKVNETFNGAMPSKAGFSGALWESNATGVVSVVSGTGVATGKSVGSGKVTGYFTTPYKTPGIVYTVAVQPAVPAVDKQTKAIKVDETFQGVMPVKEHFSGAKWETSNPLFATVSPEGLVTAVGVGEVKITGKFTTPYETLAIEYTVTVSAKA